MRPVTIWLSADAELPVRSKKTIASGKRMLIVFWEIHGGHIIAGSQKIAQSIHRSFMKNRLKPRAKFVVGWKMIVVWPLKFRSIQSENEIDHLIVTAKV
jgi:hypothetical protein